jgi:hypothetical protein
MRRRAALSSVIALAAIVNSAPAMREGPSYAAEPWAGWWWPMVCAAPVRPCPNCPYHLWTGPPVTSCSGHEPAFGRESNDPARRQSVTEEEVPCDCRTSS